MAAEAFTPFTFESTGHRYDVMRVLMEHPFAPTQWVARRTEKDSEVARVVLLRQVAGDTVGERVTRASQEAAALRAWSHTKIATVLGVAQHEGAVFVVTEHDAGMLLASVFPAPKGLE